MNIGRIDITATAESVTLRLRHVVENQPGAMLTHSEVRELVAVLQRSIEPDPMEELLG